MTLFLYGTLRHIPLLTAVMGRAPEAGQLTPATLADATVALVEGQNLPMVSLGTGGQAEGLLLSGIAAEERARLDFFEAGFSYGLRGVETSAGPADIYIPGPEIGPPGRPFDLQKWAEEWGPYAIEVARETMAHFGPCPAEKIAELFRGIRLRAWARVNAQSTCHAGQGFRGRVEVESRRMGYADFFAVEDYHLRFEQFDGADSALVRRSVFLGMDAAIVLPYDPVRDRVLVVEQMRMGPLGRADPDCWQLEPVAGHVDPGETPEEAARREAQEEAGLAIHDLIPIAEGYPSPGASSEFYYIYAALTDLPDGITGSGGIAAEGENVRTHLLGFSVLMEMVEDRRASNVPLVLATYWLAHHRARLRA